MKIFVFTYFLFASLAFAAETTTNPSYLNKFIDTAVDNGLSIDHEGNVAFSPEWSRTYDFSSHSTTYLNIDGDTSQIVRMYGASGANDSKIISRLTNGLIFYGGSSSDTLKVVLLNKGKITSVTQCEGSLYKADNLSCTSINKELCDRVIKESDSKNAEDFSKKVNSCRDISESLPFVSKDSEETTLSAENFLKDDPRNKNFLKDRKLKDIPIQKQVKDFDLTYIKLVATACIAIKGFSSTYQKEEGIFSTKVEKAATFQPTSTDK